MTQYQIQTLRGIIRSAEDRKSNPAAYTQKHGWVTGLIKRIVKWVSKTISG
jgi:hypothetical protein